MTSNTEVANEKPMSSPVRISTVIPMRFVTTSESVRPASTAARDIGSDRKRSMSPLRRSSDSPSAVAKPPNAMFCTTMPGMRKSL
jgi:hypothetical protein